MKFLPRPGQGSLPVDCGSDTADRMLFSELARLNLHFAHSRLAIIDLATGDQPMVGTDTGNASVFSGEIYNYVEVRGSYCLSVEVGGRR